MGFSPEEEKQKYKKDDSWIKLSPEKATLAEHFKRTGAYQLLVDSEVFVDCRLLLFDGEALWYVSHQFVDLLKKKFVILPEYAGGMSEATAILVAGFSVVANDKWAEEVRGFFVNGTLIEGWCPLGAKVVLFDDDFVVPGRLKNMVKNVQENGAEVIAVCCVLDRENGVKELLAELQVPFYPLLTLAELKFHMSKR